MADIVIGPGAVDRGSFTDYGVTRIDLANPANASGNITSVEIWALSGYDLTGTIKIGTFSGSGTDYTCRDYATLASPVVAGSKQTRTVDSEGNPLSIEVEEGDYLGIFFENGWIERDSSGGSGYYAKDGDQFDAGEQTYSLLATFVLSIYGTGETPPPPAAGRSWGCIIG